MNADNIAAVTGELLSANMFSYCMNNPINMHDYDGNRPDFGDGLGNETDEEKADSFGMMYSKTRVSQGDSGLRDLPDEEISKRAKDKSLSPQERRKYQTEEKYRDLRNVNKRKQKYQSKVVVNVPSISIGMSTLMVVGGVLLIGGTLIEDAFTGGVGIADDGITISTGAGMIIKAFS